MKLQVQFRRELQAWLRIRLAGLAGMRFAVVAWDRIGGYFYEHRHHAWIWMCFARIVSDELCNPMLEQNLQA